MKTNGRIRELLAIKCLNDIEYGHRVLWPLMDYLGIPSEMRRPQFQIENPFGTGLLRLDYLIHVGDVPMVTIEGEPKATLFQTGLKQAKNYSTNFKPRQRDCVMREMTVPFLIIAAGERAEMRRAVAHGLNIEYEPVRHGGQPAFLEWHELLEEAGRVPIFGRAAAQPGLLPELEPAATVGQDEILRADAARQFFEDLYSAIDSAASLRDKDDRKILLLNRVIELARRNHLGRIKKDCTHEGLGKRATANVLEAISWYEEKVQTNEFAGPAVARGYRNFLVQPGGRGGHWYFTGETQHRPYVIKGKVCYRQVARYFTPPEVIQQMVRLAEPRAAERVIDPTCGSGGFLAECVDYVARAQGSEPAQRFLAERVVGIDDDPFCVSCTRALLTFLYPDRANQLQVFLHNCLYEQAPAEGEFEEDDRAEPHLRAGQYDLVIGNPPGNDEYSGSNREAVARLWEERFGHSSGGLMDHHCFLRRAVELARPDGGRVCLLVPEGLLARDNRGLPQVRQELLRDCELRAVISLPRVFKNNNARMAVLYLVRNPNWNRSRTIVLASVLPEWKDEDGAKRTTDLFAELETVVDRYRSEVETANRALPPGNGLADFPQTSGHIAEDDEEAEEA
jgi:hypothetical protein